MARRIVMPTFGMYTVEATLVRWLVPAGARVEAGDSIVEIEAEKASYEVEAPASGIVHPTAAEGEGLQVEGLIGWILAEGEAPPTDGGAAETASSPLPAAPERSSPQPPAVKASPAARRLAAEKSVAESLVPRYLATASRLAALIPLPMAFILPDSRAAKIVCQGIWRRV